MEGLEVSLLEYLVAAPLAATYGDLLRSAIGGKLQTEAMVGSSNRLKHQKSTFGEVG